MQGVDIDRLVQERRNSIVNTLELRLSCTNPSIYHSIVGLKWGPISLFLVVFEYSNIIT